MAGRYTVPPDAQGNPLTAEDRLQPMPERIEIGVLNDDAPSDDCDICARRKTWKQLAPIWAAKRAHLCIPHAKIMSTLFERRDVVVSIVILDDEEQEGLATA